MYNNQFGYNPYYQPLNNNFTTPNAVNNQISAVNNVVNNRQFLNGKLVDSVEVAKTIEYPLDGSVSYFPLTDGTAIITKQLKQDGTSKTTIYKPIEEKESAKIQYATIDDLKRYVDDLDLDQLNDIKDDIKELKSEIKKMKKNE